MQPGGAGSSQRQTLTITCVEFGADPVNSVPSRSLGVLGFPRGVLV